MCVHPQALLEKVIPQNGRRYFANTSTHRCDTIYSLLIVLSVFLQGEGGGKSLEQEIDKEKIVKWPLNIQKMLNSVHHGSNTN